MRIDWAQLRILLTRITRVGQMERPFHQFREETLHNTANISTANVRRNKTARRHYAESAELRASVWSRL